MHALKDLWSCLAQGTLGYMRIDREFSAVAKAALDQAEPKPFVVEIDDPVYKGPGERLGRLLTNTISGSFRTT